MSRVEVTAAGPAEAAVVHALTLAAFAPYVSLTPPSGALRESVDLVRDELAAYGGAIAYAGTTPVGCLRFADRDGVLFARRVAVLPDWQGRGVGRALMAWAEDFARAAGRGELRLGVRTTLEGNRRFYERLGYRLVAEHTQPDGSPFWVELGKALL